MVGPGAVIVCLAYFASEWIFAPRAAWSWVFHERVGKCCLSPDGCWLVLETLGTGTDSRSPTAGEGITGADHYVFNLSAGTARCIAHNSPYLWWEVQFPASDEFRVIEMSLPGAAGNLPRNRVVAYRLPEGSARELVSPSNAGNECDLALACEGRFAVGTTSHNGQLELFANDLGRQSELTRFAVSLKGGAKPDFTRSAMNSTGEFISCIITQKMTRELKVWRLGRSTPILELSLGKLGDAAFFGNGALLAVQEDRSKPTRIHDCSDGCKLIAEAPVSFQLSYDKRLLSALPNRPGEYLRRATGGYTIERWADHAQMDRLPLSGQCPWPYCVQSIPTANKIACSSSTSSTPYYGDIVRALGLDRLLDVSLRTRDYFELIEFDTHHVEFSRAADQRGNGAHPFTFACAAGGTALLLCYPPSLDGKRLVEVWSLPISTWHSWISYGLAAIVFLAYLAWLWRRRSRAKLAVINPAVGSLGSL